MISQDLFVVLSYADVLVYGVMNDDDPDAEMKAPCFVNGKRPSAITVRRKIIRLVGRFPSHDRYSFVLPLDVALTGVGMCYNSFFIFFFFY
jgi:hypothetical protein